MGVENRLLYSSFKKILLALFQRVYLKKPDSLSLCHGYASNCAFFLIYWAKVVERALIFSLTLPVVNMLQEENLSFLV